MVAISVCRRPRSWRSGLSRGLCGSSQHTGSTSPLSQVTAIDSFRGPAGRSSLPSAEFRTSFFESCLAHGFDFVIRLRRPATLYDGQRFVSFEEVKERASTKPECLGMLFPYNTNRRGQFLRIVLGAKTKRMVRSDDGFYETRWLEPWLLATSLDNPTAKEIARIYGLRMRIERELSRCQVATLRLGVRTLAVIECRAPQRAALDRRTRNARGCAGWTRGRGGRV